MEWLILIAGILNLSLGLLVLKRSGTKVGSFFSVFIFISVILIGFDYTFRFFPNLTVLRSAYAFAALTAGAAFSWAYYFVKPEIKFDKIILYSLPAFFLAILCYIDGLIVIDIDYLTILGYKGLNGPLFSFYSGILALYLIATLTVLLRHFVKSTGVKKAQIRFILFGLIGYGLSAITFSLVLPTIFGIYDLTLLDAPSSIIFVGFTTFAIAKYRLMNIRKVIAKSVLYFLLISLVSSIFAFTTFLIGELFHVSSKYSELIILMSVSFIIVVGIDPLKRILAKVTDDIFYKDKIDYSSVLKQMSIIIAKEIDLQMLISSLTKTIDSELKVKNADILVKKDSTFYSTSTDFKLASDKNLVDYLEKSNNVIITEEFFRKTADLPESKQKRQFEQIVDLLERHGIEFVVPVNLEEDLKAIIIIGPKQSEDIYTTEDVSFFTGLAPQVAVALEKSQLYESIGEFNLKLQEKVNRATRELKDTNFRLQEANAHLKQLDRAKSEFLSIASHQLRTPISAIKGYLSMLLEGDFGVVEEKQRKIIADLFESASRLARLINIFLNVSRIESGRFKLDKTWVNINDLTESVIKELRGQAENKGLAISFTPMKDAPKMLIDSDKIREVILNLVDNGIKYTPKGSIKIRTYEKNNMFHFSITDTGVGIREEEVQQLFRKFVRGRGIAQVNTQGSGLGLYIAQRVITEHGGKIWAESLGLSKGSVFSFSIPYAENVKK